MYRNLIYCKPLSTVLKLNSPYEQDTFGTYGNLYPFFYVLTFSSPGAEILATPYYVDLSVPLIGSISFSYRKPSHNNLMKYSCGLYGTVT